MPETKNQPTPSWATEGRCCICGGGKHQGWASHFCCVSCLRECDLWIEHSGRCPFCGSDDVGWNNRIDDDESGRGAITKIECSNCRSAGPATTGGAAIAVKGWNWRGDAPEFLSKDRRQVGPGWSMPEGVSGEITTEASPCPFCSFSELWVVNYSDLEGEVPPPEQTWYVYCPNCFGQGPSPDCENQNTRALAIESWNKRTQ